MGPAQMNNRTLRASAAILEQLSLVLFLVHYTPPLGPLTGWRWSLAPLEGRPSLFPLDDPSPITDGASGLVLVAPRRNYSAIFRASLPRLSWCSLEQWFLTFLKEMPP